MKQEEKFLLGKTGGLPHLEIEQGINLVSGLTITGEACLGQMGRHLRGKALGVIGLGRKKVAIEISVIVSDETTYPPICRWLVRLL